MNALDLDLDGFLIIDPDDLFHPAFVRTEDEAREAVAEYFAVTVPQLRVLRMADGIHYDVTLDFLPDDDDEEPDAYDRAASVADRRLQMLAERA